MYLSELLKRLGRNLASHAIKQLGRMLVAVRGLQ